MRITINLRWDEKSRASHILSHLHEGELASYIADAIENWGRGGDPNGDYFGTFDVETVAFYGEVFEFEED